MKAPALIVAAALGLGNGQAYRSQIDGVRIDVLALDGNRPIGGLGARDFIVLDNGVRQQIEVLRQEAPISLSLVLDTSESVSGGPLRWLQDASRGAIAALRSGDQASVITFSDGLSGQPAWTSDSALLDDAISRTKGAGKTSLYDATFAALLHVDADPERRHLIVVFTDGHDTGSLLPLRAGVAAASRSDAVVYAVTTSTRGPSDGWTLWYRSGIRLTPDAPMVDSTPFLREVTSRTGGTFVATSFGGLRSAFERSSRSSVPVTC